VKVTEIAPLLKARSITQAKLAQRLGISRVHVSQLLSGKRRMNVDTLHAIEAFLAEAQSTQSPPGVAEARAAYSHSPLPECLTLEEARKARPVKRMSEEERALWYREIRELGEAGKRLPRVTHMTDDEILGYDETP
jgi:transcriptional regulator with XRE-family HTH domain